MTVKCSIRTMTSSDWPEVVAIYLAGIATGQATFETTAPAWEKWDASHLATPRFVAVPEEGEGLAGWCALSPVSARAVYAGVAEVSVYIAEGSRGCGVGGALLDALITASEDNGIWTLQASVFPENTSSVAMHVKRGFREIGRRQRIAKLNGIWRDTILLERRSQIAGVD